VQIKDILSKLNITNTTLKNWIDRFAGYFSETAKQRNRSFTQEDLDLLATIAKLSASGLTYDAIEKHIAMGEREIFEDTTLGTDTRMIPAAVVEQVVDSTKIMIELEKTKSELAKALDMLETERGRVETLQREVRELERALGRAEGELEYRRKQDKD
jgi:DNA-binding transcriptional MerR regulator